LCQHEGIYLIGNTPGSLSYQSVVRLTVTTLTGGKGTIG
jgi:hypothetical protein